jgi:hypothetical protein
MDTPAVQQIANIGAGERRKRLVVGIAAFVAGVLLAIGLSAVAAPLIWRLPLIFIFYAGALGFFQSRDKT